MLEHYPPPSSTLFSVWSSFEDSENASPFFGESPPISQLSLVKMCKLCGAKAVALGRRRLWGKGRKRPIMMQNQLKTVVWLVYLRGAVRWYITSSTRGAQLSHTLMSMSTVRRSKQQIKCSFNHFCPWNWFHWQTHTLLLTDHTQPWTRPVLMSTSWAHSESLSWR